MQKSMARTVQSILKCEQLFMSALSYLTKAQGSQSLAFEHEGNGYTHFKRNLNFMF